MVSKYIFEKIRRLKKHRILAGLIHFSRLKLAFFKKLAFLPTQRVSSPPQLTTHDLNLLFGFEIGFDFLHLIDLLFQVVQRGFPFLLRFDPFLLFLDHLPSLRRQLLQFASKLSFPFLFTECGMLNTV